MHRAIFTLIVGLVLTSCSLTTTGTDNISFGMSRDTILKRIVKDGDEIVVRSDSQIIAVGEWELAGDMRQKVYSFENGKLINVEYVPLEQ